MQNPEQYIPISSMNTDAHPSAIDSEGGIVLAAENLMPDNRFLGAQGAATPIYSTSGIENETNEDGDEVRGSYYDAQGGNTYYFIYNPDTTKQKIIRTDGVGYTEVVIKGYPLQISAKVTDVSFIDGYLGFCDGEVYGRLIDTNRAVRTGKLTEAEVYFGKPDTGTTIFINGQVFSFGYTLPDGTVVAAVPFWTCVGFEDDLVGGCKEFVARFNLLFSATVATAEYCGCGEVTIRANAPYYGTELYKTMLFDLNCTIPVGGSGIAVSYRNIYSDTIGEPSVNRAKYQPKQQPEVRMGADTTRAENYVSGKAWQFAYRFLYRGGYTGTASPYSLIPAAPSDCSASQVSGFNYVDVDFSGAGELRDGDFLSELDGVEILVRELNTGDFFRAATLKLCDLGVQRNFYRWYNDTLPAGISQLQALKQYEDIPFKHFAEENATPQNMENTRAFIGNGLYGFDNLCPDVEVATSIAEDAECSALYDLTIRAKVINPYIDSTDIVNGDFRTQCVWKDPSAHDNPAFGTNYAVFGGIGTSLAGTVNGIDDDYHQVLPDGRFYCNIIGTDFIGLFVQNRPDPTTYPDLEYYDYEKGVYLGETVAQRNEIRDVIADDEVWMECVIRNVPPGRYQIQMVSHWCSETGAFLADDYDISSGGKWKRTSTYVLAVGDDAKADQNPPPYEPTRVIEVDLPYTTSGSNIPYDIFSTDGLQFIVADLSDVRAINTAFAIDGYYLDSLNGSVAVPDLQTGIRAEMQGFSPNVGQCPFYSDTLLDNTVVTDHNGFVFWTNSNPVILNVRAKCTPLFENNEAKYIGTLADLTNNTLVGGQVALQTVGASNTKHYIFPRYLNDGSYLPDTLRLTATDSVNGYPVQGLLCVPFMCNRPAQTDQNGVAEMVVYPFLSILWVTVPPATEFRSTQAAGSGACCMDVDTYGSIVYAAWEPIDQPPSDQTYDETAVIITDVLVNFPRWLAGGGYLLGIAYYDNQNRQSFVQWNENMRFRMKRADQGISGREFPYVTIRHLPPQDGTAASYQLVVTESDLRLKVQTIISDAEYYIYYESDTDNSQTTFAGGDATEVHIPLTPMSYFNQQHPFTTVGYTYEKGDRLRILTMEDGTTPPAFYEAEVLGLVGDALVIANQNSLPQFREGMLIGIYRLAETQQQPFYWEFAQRYPVYQSGGAYYHDGGQSFGLIVGQPQTALQPAIVAMPYGDTYRRDRVMQAGVTGGIYRPSIESRHMSDFFVSDAWARGRANVVNLSARREWLQTVRFSNPYRPYAYSNGLYAFDATDNKILPYQQTGEITCMRFVSGVMLVLCRVRPVSLYIGERMVTSAEGANILSVSDGVIGAYNVFETVFRSGGTTHPESVVVTGGHCYWYADYDGVVMRYASNSPFPVSSYGMDTLFSATKGTPQEYTPAAFDKLTGTYQIWIQSDENPIDKFEAPEELSPTIYTYDVQAERWRFYIRTPLTLEWLATGTNASILTGEEGSLHTWEVKDVRAEIMGEPMKQKALIVFNPARNIEKMPLYLKSKTFFSSTTPTLWTARFLAYTPQGYVQMSRLESGNFVFRNNEWLATMLRDENDTTVANPLLNGGFIKCSYMLSLLTNEETTAYSTSYFAFGYTTAEK